MDTNETDDLRTELQELLNRAELWLRQLIVIPETSVDRRADLERDADTLRRDRTRAASTLINVALFGAFSSGKSFLVSGLQGHLDLTMVPRAKGRPAEMFVGMLPSSPVPTNACPVSVVPVDDELQFDTSGTGYMRVRFEDSPEWENVGNSPALSVVAAYVTQDANIADRLKAHRDRRVAEVQILIDQYKLRAKLYDLPGAGSPNRIHDKILKSAMADADCFIYVCHAASSLSDNDLELIGALYEHYLLTKRTKRVIWVVTATDAARQLDHQEKEAWELTVAKNDAYLKEHYKLNNQPDIEFINEGFVPVSPAAESRAAWHTDRGDDDAARNHLDEGQMDSLRDVLEELISRDAGKRHIAQVAGGAGYVVSRHERALTQRLRDEREPIDNLKASMANSMSRLEFLETTSPRIREELEKDLKDYVTRAARPFSKLANHLHAALDERIRSTDISRPQNANQIQVAKAQLIQNWIESKEGPGGIWRDCLARFKDDVFALMKARFNEDFHTNKMPDNPFDVNELTVQRPQQASPSAQDVMQRTAAVVGVAAPVAAAASWVLGAVTAGAVFPPAGAIVGLAALVYAGIERSKKKGNSLERLQQEWISALDLEAKNIREQFELATGTQGIVIIDNVVDYLNSYRTQIAESIGLIQERMAHPESRGLQELVDRIEALCRDGKELELGLWRLANS